MCVCVCVVSKLDVAYSLGGIRYFPVDRGTFLALKAPPRERARERESERESERERDWRTITRRDHYKRARESSTFLALKATLPPTALTALMHFSLSLLIFLAP